MELALRGGSMRPLLKTGDTAELDVGAPMRPGDIVVYRVEGRLLAHRLAWRGQASSWVFDDAAEVGWHRVTNRSLLGRLRHPSPWTSGVPGLSFACIIYVFSLFRNILKDVTLSTPPRA